MTGKCGLTGEHVARILGNESLEHAALRLRPDMESLPRVPAGSAKVSAARARALWDEIGGDPTLRAINPHFPALRSDSMALSGASRRKQSPSNKVLASQKAKS